MDSRDAHSLLLPASYTLRSLLPYRSLQLTHLSNYKTNTIHIIHTSFETRRVAFGNPHGICVISAVTADHRQKQRQLLLGLQQVAQVGADGAW